MDYRISTFDMTEEDVIEFIIDFQPSKLKKCCSMK